jgi:hypothetical protein
MGKAEPGDMGISGDEHKEAKRWETFGIKCTGIHQPVMDLSKQNI